MDDFMMPCGCEIAFELDQEGDYGYGGEIYYSPVLVKAWMKNPCPEHTSAT